jgi:hypothetical protein
MKCGDSEARMIKTAFASFARHVQKDLYRIHTDKPLLAIAIHPRERTHSSSHSDWSARKSASSVTISYAALELFIVSLCGWARGLRRPPIRS